MRRTTFETSESIDMSTDHTPPTAAATFSEEDVPLDELVIDPKLQLRTNGHEDAYVSELVVAVKDDKLTAPVVVFRDDGGTLRLADGHARVEASRRAGKTTVRARVFKGGLHEAFVHALGANATHGTRRSSADLHNAVKAALVEPKMLDWSNVQIAGACGCSDHFVGKVRKALETSSIAPSPTHRTGKDGKRYPVKRGRHEPGSIGSNLAPTEAMPSKAVPADAEMTIEALLFAPDTHPAEVSGAGGVMETAPVRDAREGDGVREVRSIDDDAHATVSPDHATTLTVLEDLAYRPKFAPARIVKAAEALVYAVTKAGFLAQYPLDGEPPTPPVLRARWNAYAEGHAGRPSA
jgi:hypothetical protein